MRHPEKVRESKRAYYLRIKSHPRKYRAFLKKRSAYKKAWELNNPEMAKECRKRRWQSLKQSPERLAEEYRRVKRWEDANRESRRQHKRNYMRKLRGSPREKYKLP